MKLLHKSKTLLAILLVLAVTSGCAGKGDVTITKPLSPSVSDDDNAWSEQAEGTIVLENQGFLFELDAETTHFVLTDKRTGEKYFSVPEGLMASGDDASRMVSEVTIKYYGQQTNELYMYSGVDSVPSGNFKIKTNGSTIRVYYTMGSAGVFAPEVFSREEFETQILDKIESAGMRRRMARYYVLYSSEEQPADYQDRLSQYPVLKSAPLYIMDSAVSDVEKEEISGYLSEIGYTEEMYQEHVKSLGVEVEVTEQPAGFLIPIEYQLVDDGFTVKILSDRIEEFSDEYKLQSIDCLEYFSSFDANSKGSYIVPDGSGALFTMGGTASGEYVHQFYGTDFAVQKESQTQIEKNLMLPVFGIQTGRFGILAIVEQAAEVGFLNVKPLSDSSPHNRIYVSFEMRSIDITDLGQDKPIPVYNLFTKNIISQNPQIRFIALNGEENSYAAMAARYREYLLQNNTFSGSQPQNANVYLDFLCMITEDASFLGVPYVKKTVLSTLDQIQQIVDKMHESQIKGIVVRLIGYGSGGLENYAYNRFSIDRRVGSKEQLKKLAKTLADYGGQLVLDADFMFAYSKGNGFSPASDSAKYLNRTVVRSERYDIVNRKFYGRLGRYFISPMRYQEYAENFADGIRKLSDGGASIGLSYGTAGLYLGGDYAPKRGVDRINSAAYLTNAVKSSSQAAGDIVFDNGNAYIIPYADHILNAPFTSSQSDMEAKGVPFYQMVLHGLVSYAGTPYNLTGNLLNAHLKSLAYGGLPYYALITADDDLLSNTAYESMWYSLSQNGRLETLIEQCKASKEYFDSVRYAQMTGFEEITPDVTCTSYSNGVRIYVNYGDSNTAVDGVEIKAKGFAVIRAE